MREGEDIGQGEYGGVYSDEEYEDEVADKEGEHDNDDIDRLRDEGAESRALLENLLAQTQPPANTGQEGITANGHLDGPDAGEDCLKNPKDETHRVHESVEGQPGGSVNPSGSDSPSRTRCDVIRGQISDLEASWMREGSLQHSIFHYGIRLMCEEIIVEVASRACQEAAVRAAEHRRNEARARREAERERQQQAPASLLHERMQERMRRKDEVRAARESADRETERRRRSERRKAATLAALAATADLLVHFTAGVDYRQLEVIVRAWQDPVQ